MDGALSMTPRLNAILAHAAEIARSMDHDYIGVEHIFLGILHDPAAVPTQVLASLIPPADVEAKLRDLMQSPEYRTPTFPRG